MDFAGGYHYTADQATYGWFVIGHCWRRRSLRPIGPTLARSAVCRLRRYAKSVICLRLCLYAI